MSPKKVRECGGVSGQLPVLLAPWLSIWSGKNRLLPRELSAISQSFADKVYNVGPVQCIYDNNLNYIFLLTKCTYIAVSSTSDPSWEIKLWPKMARKFLPCPKMVCAYGLSLSLGAPLPGGACLGSLGLSARWHLVAEGFLCPNSVEN